MMSSREIREQGARKPGPIATESYFDERYGGQVFYPDPDAAVPMYDNSVSRPMDDVPPPPPDPRLVNGFGGAPVRETIPVERHPAGEAKGRGGQFR
jgi:hypothetical protein